MTINVFGGGDSSGPVFPLQRSVRLRASNSAYFNRTPASAGNRTTWTLSAWVKRGSLGGTGILIDVGGTANLSDYQMLWFSSDAIDFHQQTTTGYTARLVSTAVCRDPSSWYHIVAVWNTTSGTTTLTGTPTDRMQLWVNGVQLTSFSTTVVPSSSLNSRINLNALTTIGQATSGTAYSFDGYLTEVNFIDGQALTPASFGSYNSTTGVWQPIKYSGTYGTNGFYLNFNDNSNNTAATIGKDNSGNSNNWTPNGISVTAGVTYDSMLDVPTLTSATNANFCTLNPLKSQTAPTAGNLQVSSPTVYGSRTTMAVSSGKWYWEVTATTTTSFSVIGVLPATIPLTVDAGFTSSSNSAYYVSGSKILNGALTAYGSSWTSGDIIGVALDCNANTIQFYKNNTAQGSFTLYTSTGTEIQPFVCDENNSGSVFALNFGQRPFSYTPPTGFKSLNTYNLPASTIPNGATQFAATTYTGTGSSLAIANTVNGKSFQPDFVWVKGRSGATDHALYDSVRGTTKQLESNTTTAETTEATGLTAFDTGGFTVGALAQMNTSTATYVGWQWKAGGTAVTNTSGSISSQVSANPSAGFSIVTYTGTGANATVGHGLGIAPRMIIVKNRDSGAIGGAVYHASLGATKYLQLFQTTTGNASETTDNTAWNGGSPTFSSSVFSVGALNRTNSAQQMVAYCFSEIAGYSKFGSYIGNNALDGPFIYCGFIPRFILFKNSNASTDWTIFDTSRDTFNLSTKYLIPNTSGQETSGSSVQLDVLSNGFKVRGTWAGMNTSGNTIIFAAFAESPFSYSLAR